MSGGHGILLIDKPAGITSHTVAARVRRSLSVRRAGHAGTLDPAATGLMVVGVGAGTRLLGHLVGLDKTYTATMRLGVGTTTDDADGDVIAAPGCPADFDYSAAVTALTGTIRQRPAAVSAVKVGGRRSYERVRRGEHVELPPREVHVASFDVLAARRVTESGVAVVDLDVRVSVSSGTYVRALARDLGASLGTAGHLISLRRTRVGPFEIGDAVALPDVGPHTPLLQLGDVAAAVMPAVVCSAGDARAVAAGQRIQARATTPGTHALLADDGGLLAVAAVDAGRWRYAMVVPPDASGQT